MQNEGKDGDQIGHPFDRDCGLFGGIGNVPIKFEDHTDDPHADSPTHFQHKR